MRRMIPGQRSAGGLILPPGADVHSNDTSNRDVMTVREYLQKPHAPVTRGELAAFIESLLHGQIKEVIAYVVDHKTEAIEEACKAMIEEAFRQHAEQSWWRRVTRWFGRGRRAEQAELALARRIIAEQQAAKAAIVPPEAAQQRDFKPEAAVAEDHGPGQDAPPEVSAHEESMPEDVREQTA